ncbi:MAG: HAD-IA family hydrolase [Candidatus Lokiarchaeota archaeon]|nr:HAD-IA family hydrolase [Candidatus Lokiarchaeota archaeon]
MEKITLEKYKGILKSTNLRVFIFDFDGTLLDVNKPLERSIQETFEENNIEINLNKTKKEIGRVLESIQGLPFPKIILRSYEISNSLSSLQNLSYFKRLQIAAKLFAKYFDYEKDSLLISKAKELLEKLSSEYDIFVVSNNQSKNLYHHIEEKKIGKYFKGVYGADDLTSLKPDPLSLHPILTQYPLLERKQFVIIGDMPTDIEAGKRAGIWTIGITSGISNKELLSEQEPDLIVDSLSSLGKIFK